MRALKLARLIGTMTIVASTPVLLAVAAHAQLSPPATEQAPPGTRSMQPGLPQAGAPTAAPAAEPATPGKDALFGLAVFGSDGQKVGEVQGVKSEPDGKVTEIHVRIGGFLGFGGKTVAIPAAKFNRSGQNVQLALTSDDVVKMPVVVEKPS